MRYQKASEILQVELVELIQDYIDGEYVYIPRKQENKKNWGEASRTREEFRFFLISGLSLRFISGRPGVRVGSEG